MNRNVLAALLAALLLAGCTVQLFGPAKKGVVVLSFEAPSEVRSALSRAAGSSRTLSVSDDLASLTYQAVNTATGATEASGSIDPADPVVQLKLTAGQKYRIIVDAVPQAGGPGSSTGVYRFGDEALVSVPADGSWAYAFLAVRPTQSLVFHTATDSTMVSAWDPATGSDRSLALVASAYPSETDAFFYGPRGELYYFNQYENSVYQWTDISASLDNSDNTDRILWGDDLSLEIETVAADPWIDGGLVLVAIDNDSSSNTYDHHQIYRLYPTANGWYIWSTVDIEDALGTGFYDDGEIVPNAEVTSVAVDPLSYSVYVGSWTYGYYGDTWDANNPNYKYRSMVQMFVLGATEPEATYGADPIFEGTNSSSIKDLKVWGGDLWALGGTTEGGYSSYYYRGRSDILRLSNLDLSLVEAQPSAFAGDYTSSDPYPSAEPVTANGSLADTVKFATGWYDGVFYVNQTRPGSYTEDVTTQHRWLTGESAELSVLNYASGE